jgi:hypothetical protein
MPAETPLLLQTFPSTAHRACGIQCALGSTATTLFQAALFVVALTPANKPVLATTIDPVHTVIKYFSFGYVALIYSSVALRFGARAPAPPGISRTSMSEGAVAKVWVGGMETKALELNLFIEADTGLVEMGSSVSASQAMSMRVLRERVKRAS